MRDLFTSLEFWVAVAFAVILKLRTSENLTIWGALVTTTTGVGSALVFTHPAADYLSLDVATYSPAIAALIALTFEHLARHMLRLSPLDLLKAWRGK